MSKGSSYKEIYSDADILVLDKAAGVAVLAERWERGVESLLDGVRQRWPQAVAVHRIDKETSGLLLMGLNPAASRALQVAFETRRVAKFYHALVVGNPAWDETACDLPLLIDGDRLHRSVVCRPGQAGARNCESRFRVLERYRSFALVEVRLLTGRTHQIRAHAAELGHPLAGDHLYGGPKDIRLSALKPGWRGDRAEERPLLARVGLHARRIEFAHPGTGQTMNFDAEYPKDLRAALTQLAGLR